MIGSNKYILFTLFCSPFIDDSDDEEYDDEDDEESEEEAEKEEERKEREKMTKGEFIAMRINEMRRQAVRQQMFSGFKFEQYMTSDEPQVCKLWRLPDKFGTQQVTLKIIITCTYRVRRIPRRS